MNITMKSSVLLILAIILATFAGLTYSNYFPARGKIILATTTSTYDSGLLDYLLPDFEEKNNVEVQVIAVGTGQALEMARRGDADVILVHSPADEKKLVKEGYGVDRRCVMYNDFVIIGQTRDSAKIKGLKAHEAFKNIYLSNSTFISRGDQSGTHKKEKQIWNFTGLKPKGEWYIEVGGGMGDTLRIANEKQGYTLTDRGTYVSMLDRISLDILVEGDKTLLNPYGVIRINSSKNSRLAQAFSDYLLSKEGQDMIEGFKKNGIQLFYPLRGTCLEAEE
jgi:tungstate transport system substrate-binding protein